MAPAIELLTDSHLPPLFSLAVVYGVALVPYVPLIAFSLWRVLANRRLAALQALATADAEELRAGATVLSGAVVAHDDAELPPLRVQVEQLLVKTGGSLMRWEETDRRLEHRGFDLRLASGDAVTVEPDSHTVFAVELDQTLPLRDDGQTRRRTAELAEGDEVHVAGELVAGEGRARQAGGDYRTAPKRGWALRRSPSRKLIVSTQPLRRRFDEQAKFWRRWIWIIVAGLLLLHGGLLIQFSVSNWFGQPILAEVTNSQHNVAKRSKGGDVHRYTARAKTVDAPHRTLSFEVARESFAKVEEGSIVAARVVPWSSWFDQVGSQPTIDFVRALVAGLLLIGVVGIMILSQRLTRTWYEGAPLNEPPDSNDLTQRRGEH